VIESRIKRLGRWAGVEITRHRPFSARRARRLLEYRIATVIDVGAHTGEYGAELRASRYRGQIISLEPLSATFQELVHRSAADNAWQCHNVAAGDTDGDATLNVASNLASSSLLSVTDEHERGAPDVSYVGQERVRVRRLDSLVLDVVPPALLKIDVQGYELHVLAGAEQTVERVALIECELSIAALYERQPSFRAMIDRLADLGFEIVDLDPFFYDLEDGRVLALDALFARAT
jgi:FkbM family methyltransferase